MLYGCGKTMGKRHTSATSFCSLAPPPALRQSLNPQTSTFSAASHVLFVEMFFCVAGRKLNAFAATTAFSISRKGELKKHDFMIHTRAI